MSTRLVVGEINRADNQPWVSAPVLFYLSPGQYNISTQYAESFVEAYTNYLGQIKVLLYASDFDTNPIQYTCCLPDGETFDFTVPPGDEPINLSVLRLFGCNSLNEEFNTIIVDSQVLDKVTVTQSQSLYDIAPGTIIVPASSLTVQTNEIYPVSIDDSSFLIDLSLLRLFGQSSMQSQSPQQYATFVQYVQDLVKSTIAAMPQYTNTNQFQVQQPTNLTSYIQEVVTEAIAAIPPRPTNTNRLQTQQYSAAIALSSLSAVTIDSTTGLMNYASVNVASHGFTTIGIIPTALNIGAYGSAISSGVMQDITWNWTPGFPIFLGINGALTQNIPATNFIKQMAIALTPTQIEVNILEPIYIL